MKIEALPLEAQIASAVAKKAQNVQKQEGQAALELIHGAVPGTPHPLADGRGTLINTKA